MNRISRYGVAISVMIAVLVPLVLLALWSVTGRWVYPDLLPSISFNNLVKWLGNSTLIEPLINSIILSILVTAISFGLGFYPSKYLGTKDFRGKRILQVFIMLPALAPGIAIVFGMLPVFVRLGIYGSYEALLIGQVVFTLPYMIMTLTASFKNYDTDYEDQSVTLGMGKIDTLLNVTIPMIKSSIAVGCMYTFMVSWSMYLFTSMYSPRGFSTLATKLFPLLSMGVTPMQEIAVFTIAFFLPSLIFLIGSTLVIRSDNINERGGHL